MVSKKLKFLHCSDIHLDAPFVGMSADKSEERRRELRSTFIRMMDYVRERGIDYVLIAGDLFENAYATNTTAEVLIRQFRTCEKTKFIIAPGKCDHYENNSIYQSGRLPSNCYVFSNEKLSCFKFDDDRLTIYGWAFMTEELTTSPLYDSHVEDGGRINIVVGYADLGGEIGSTGCPVANKDMTKFGADYYAFGGRHAKTDLVRRAGAMYGYPGALESTGFLNPAMGGVKQLDIDYNGGELSIECKQFTFGRVKFVKEEIDITGVSANNEITNRISQLISAKKYGVDTALAVELVGEVSPRFVLPKKLECDVLGLYYFDMIDKTVPTYGTEKYEREMSVAGELYRHLLPMLKSENEEERMGASRAFRVGLASLEKREIDM